MRSSGAASRERHLVDREPDDGAGAEQPPRVFGGHVVLPDMHAVGAGGERHIDPVVDEERHCGRQRGLDRARALDHRAGLAHLVAQLHERRAARGHAAREVGEVMAAGHLRIDDGINAQVDAHQVTLPRSSSSARSRL